MLWPSQPALRFARTPALLHFKSTTFVLLRAPTTARFHQAPRHFESERRPPRPWTSEEVALLFNLRREKYSIKDIAIILQRSDNSVANRLNKTRRVAETAHAYKWKPWSKQEDDELKSIMAEVVTAATKISLADKWNRTPQSVDGRLYVLRRKSNMIKKGRTGFFRKPWSQGEYDLARRLRDEGKSSAYIAKTLDRTGSSVRAFFSKLPLKSKPFNEEHFVTDDELALMEQLDSQGFSHREIQKHMPHRGLGVIDRTVRALPNRKPRLTRWTKEELIKLRELYDEGKRAKDMPPYLPGRTVKACQHKVDEYIRQRETP